MQVTLIAHTIITSAMTLLTPFQKDTYLPAADELAEFAGRSCYQSWHNPAGRSNEDYIGNILDQRHFSVLEHASATFYLTGVSRSLTHELVRHRHFSFSQLSQRYVDESDVALVVPPALEGLGTELDKFMQDKVLPLYRGLVTQLSDTGLKRKQAREAARCVLPNMTETKIVVTGNHRSWREFIEKRHTLQADAEIRELARRILVELRRIAPSTYQDFPE